MTDKLDEFREVGHCGGQVRVRVANADGRVGYQLAFHHARPTAAAMFAIYALPQGIPVGMVHLGGIGQHWNPPPIAGSVPVFIASDSEGRFGHACRKCKGYWRSESTPAHWQVTCPYCGTRAGCHAFLTPEQLAYVGAYCELLGDALASAEDAEHVIDMDGVADAAGKNGPKPPFYYAEQSQQNKYTCAACADFNDILGTYGYCSCCGTRNDLQEFEGKVIPRIQETINAGGPCEAAVKETVAAFDSFARQYVKQLAQRVPMKPRRRARFDRMLFHRLKPNAEEVRAAFDIDIFDGLNSDDLDFAVLMFHRRHVYEHNGGEADEKYIRDSGDTSVKPKQALRETRETALRLTEVVSKLALNLHNGFHEIFPPEKTPIQMAKDRQAHVRGYGGKARVAPFERVAGR